MSITEHGFLTWEEICAAGQAPSEERFQKGPVVVVECVQPIPCNPCEGACHQGAIYVGEPITNLPIVTDVKCSGCGLCVAQCSGLAIFIVDKTYSDTEATVSFPHEYHPLPEKGQVVNVVNREGKVVGSGTVLRVLNPKRNDHTPVVTAIIPKELADEVRGMERLQAEVWHDDCCADYVLSEQDGDDRIVCRCEEITVGEIRRAIRAGADTLSGIKRRTRAGMGLCQGRTCSKIVARMLTAETGKRAPEIEEDTARPPMRPVSIGILAGDDEI